MIIVDDGSNDGFREYLTGLSDARIRVVCQANKGLGSALNRGLELCDTEFIARMDDDDIAHPSRLEEQIRFLRSHPDVGLVGTQIRRLGNTRMGPATVLATDHETIYADIQIGEIQMYHSTIMCRTKLLKDIGGYWTLRWGEEWDLFLRMGERSRLANLDQVLLMYRLRAESMTGSNMTRTRNAIEYACHCGRRRREGLAAVSYEDFLAQRSAATWRRRAARAVEMHARRQYQRSVMDLLGDRPLWGYLRLTGAALCSPYLTRRRIMKVVRKLAARSFQARICVKATRPAMAAHHHKLSDSQASSLQELRSEP